jgi:hypothetical protein
VKPAPLLAWLLFFLYAVWAAALQGVLASPRRLGLWVPDLGLLLLFAWAGRLRGTRGPVAALLVAAARAGFSADPPALLAANALGSLGVFGLLGSALEVDRPLARALLCGLSAFGSAAVLVGARTLVLAADAPAVALEGVSLWPGALASSLACLLFAPLCARLPGLSPLGKVRQ